MKAEDLKFDEKGLIPVITQDIETKQVLMLAYANREAVEKTLETGKAHYYSRSRRALWLKGESSGHFQQVQNMYYDCDCDALLLQVIQEGAACHTGQRSCFYRDFETDRAVQYEESDMLKQVYDVIQERRANPREGSYTNYLFDKGIDKMLKKVGEETAEVIIAAKNPDLAELRYEIADLMYHISVVMADRGLAWEDIYNELQNRRK